MEEFAKFVAGLQKKLSGPLPGINSQLRMASMRRLIENGKLVIPEDVRRAGVLVLFYPIEGQVFNVFIKRAEYPGVHSGQISFPGGGWEAHDTDIIQTALREAEEEIGLDRGLVTTIGQLTDLFIPPSNFLVTPVIGYATSRPEFIADPQEVESILEVPLDKLIDKRCIQEKSITIFPAINISVPCYYVNGHIIWGATAMMISELIDMLNQGS
jgi:8-oxo-dGTP pyrophosphatase MutT (NUDIX family)